MGPYLFYLSEDQRGREREGKKGGTKERKGGKKFPRLSSKNGPLRFLDQKGKKGREMGKAGTFPGSRSWFFLQESLAFKRFFLCTYIEQRYAHEASGVENNILTSTTENRMLLF